MWQNGSTAPPIHFQRCAPRAKFHVHVWKSVHSCNTPIPTKKSLGAKSQIHRKLVILITRQIFVSFWGFQVSYFNKLLLEKWRKFTFDMGFKVGVAKWLDSATYTLSTVCARATFHVHVWKSVHSCNTQYHQKVSWSKIPNPTGSWLFLINLVNFVSFWGFQVSYFNKLLLEIYLDEHQIWSV